MKRIMILLLTIITLSLQAQVVTWEPVYFTEDDAVTIYFNAELGSGGLKDYTGDVYAHTGLITSLSNTPSDWKYVIAAWNVNKPKAKLTRISANLYSLEISPSIMNYYLTSEGKSLQSGEVVEKLAFVFRASDGSREGKTAAGGDIFIDLRTGVSIFEPASRPYNAQADEVFTVKAAGSSVTDTLKLFVEDNLIYTTLEDTLVYDITANKLKQWIKVVGSNTEGIVVADSFYYYVNPPIISEEIPGGILDGINYIDDNTVTLALHATNRDFVYAIGDFNNWEIDPNYFMKRTTDESKYWITISNLEPGEKYGFQYLVDGTLRIADPYTEKVLDRWNDSFISDDVYPDLKSYPLNKTEGLVSVLQTAKQPYSWEVENFDKPAKEKLVIYELLVRDFVSTHSYQTLIDTLSYLKRLGINAIELMPVSEFEGNSSWGYNPSFYFAPDKYYGRDIDLKAFIDACHKEGIAVILDIVLNHAFGQNSLVQLYLDRYATDEIITVAGNPYFNVRSPNRSFYWGADFNHESPHTKEFVKRVLEHWMTEYKFDGFRFDFTKGFTNKGGDGWAYDASRISILKDYADHMWSIDPGSYVILEHLADNSEEKVLADYGMMLWGNLNHSYNEATMGYHDNNKSDFSWISYKQRGWNDPHLIGYMESHDEERLMYKNLQYGNSSGDYDITKLNIALQRIKLAAAFFFTIPGPKMIWQFGELGYDYSIDYNGRVGEKPIKWDYLNNVNRVKLYKTFAALIYLREHYEAFHTDNFLLGVSTAVKRIRLSHESMNVNILGNFDVVERTTSAVFQNTGWWYDYFSGDSINVSDVNMNIALEPGEFYIFTTEKLPTPEGDILSNVIENNEEIPNQFYLSQNYPNPFNPSTTINFAVPVRSDVKITIFNILGEVVEILHNSNIDAGTYSLSFNAAKKLSSGIYFYQIIANGIDGKNFNQTKKMMLIK